MKEKLQIEWKESELIGGDPLFMIDECNGVAVKCEPKEGLQLWFFSRIKKDDEYYCQVTKKFTIPEKLLKQHNFNRYTSNLKNEDKDYFDRNLEINLIDVLLGYENK